MLSCSTTAGAYAGGAAASEAGGAGWHLPFVFVALERGGAGAAEDQAAEAVAGGVSLPAAGSGAGRAGARLTGGEGDRAADRWRSGFRCGEAARMSPARGTPEASRQPEGRRRGIPTCAGPCTATFSRASSDGARCTTTAAGYHNHRLPVLRLRVSHAAQMDHGCGTPACCSRPRV